MKIQKMIKRIRICRMPWALSLTLVLVSLSFLTYGEDGFGVSGSDTSNMAKINALLQNVQNSHAAPLDDATNQKKTPSSADHTENTTDRLYGSDPVGNAAFANMARSLLPLTPEQIKTLHYLFDQSQRAAAQAPETPPKPTSTSMIVNLSPGAAPPVVRLQQGYVSSLVFIDATGGSWPIQAYDLGNQKNFNVQWDQKGNTLMIQALSAYEGGNLAVMLKGLDTPVMITLMPGQRAVDYRVDLRIPKIGPNPNQVLEGLPGVENPQLVSVLDGVPPEGAQPVVVKGGSEDCQAWLLDGSLYVRTPMTILSPAFISTMQSADGTHAYQLQATPILLASSRGKTVKLMIEGL